jgi:putative oxidoreductase
LDCYLVRTQIPIRQPRLLGEKLEKISMNQVISSPPDQPISPLRVRRLHPPGWLAALLSTTDSAVPTLLRVALGGVILGHGLQKVFGWFGGYGLAGTMNFFASLGMPSVLGALVIISDFVGSLAIVAGFLTRFSAAAAFAVMLGATALVHLPNGFFMNWGGAARGEGYEFHVLAMAMAASLVLSGGGRASLDGWLGGKLGKGRKLGR